MALILRYMYQINEYIYLIKFLNYHALMFLAHRLHVDVCTSGLPAKKEMGMQLHVDLEATEPDFVSKQAAL